MLNITKEKQLEKWFPYGDDEEYLVRFNPSLDGIKFPLDWAEAIFLSWKGVTGADDLPLPCNRATLNEFMRTQAGVERFEHFKDIAHNWMKFTGLDDSIKNSIAPSSGDSTGQAVPPNGARSASESASQQSLAITAH